MLDIHCHILPHIDDGSVSMQMTQDMLKAAKEADIHFIIATPHFRSRDIDREKIGQVFSEVQNAAVRYDIQMRLGYEVNISMLPHLEMHSMADWCVQGTNVILLEFSNTTRPAHWDILVCDLIRSGYQPIIVHPERYIYIQKAIGIAAELTRYGCELQLDAMALDHWLSFGNAEMNTAKKLLQSEMVDYIASDAHRPEYYQQLARVRKRLGRRWPENGVLHGIFSA